MNEENNQQITPVAQTIEEQSNIEATQAVSAPMQEQTIITVEDNLVAPNVTPESSNEVPADQSAVPTYIPSEDDIVIDEDFQINIEVKPVSENPDFNVEKKENSIPTVPDVETPISTEQTGNITF